MDTELSSKGYKVALKSLPPHFLQNIRSELTVKPLENPNYPSGDRPFPVYRLSKTNVYLPRFYGFEKYLAAKRDCLPLGQVINLTFNGDLREIQQRTIDATLTAFSKYGGGIISLDTGLGKTVVALKLIELMKVKTIIVVHAEFLLEQWVSRIKQFLPDARIGIIRQERCETENVDITVAMVQTVINREYAPGFFDSYGLQCFDECFPYRQFINTDQGAMKIGTLYNLWNSKKTLPLVLSFNETTGKTEYKKITHAWEKQNENLLKISYSKSNIKCTENHRILTPTGYIEANKLNVGDLIKCNYSENLEESMVARQLNGDQYQIVLGSFLGDGHISILPSQRYRLSIIHGEKQKEYCEWKASMFGSKIERIENNGYAKGIAYKFCTKVFDFPNLITKNYKTCPQWILDDLDYKGLAIWWMDDGSLCKDSFRGTLSTCSFDEETHIRFIKKFKSMDVSCHYANDGHGYLSIYFNKEDIYSLFKKIRPYLHESLRYKFYNIVLEQATEQFFNGTIETVYTNIRNINPSIIRENCTIKVLNNTIEKTYVVKNCDVCNNLQFHLTLNRCCNCNSKKEEYYNYLEPPKNEDLYVWDTTFLEYGTVKITSIEKIKNKDTRVYDIEVEDNHNFICCSPLGIGPIVHNCHHVAAKSFSSLFYKVQTKYMVGLSATPERKDGLSKVLYWFFGPQIITIKRETGKPSIRFIFNNTKDYTEEFNQAGRVNNPAMITNLTKQQARNELIVNTVKSLVAGRKTLILSDRREHCENIAAQLVAAGITAGVYLGGMSTQDREATTESQVIVGTYQASGEGFDVPLLDTLILATPKSDVEQAVGRILRQKNANEPLVIDIVDEFSIFKGQYIKRHRFYKKCEYKIVEQKR
jgi:superfamily II DNA or RNA helicase/intein/homing endonuclease